jgi:hypothetical protein
MDIKKMAREVVDCIHLVQDTEKWQSLVTTVPKFWFPQKLAALQEIFHGVSAFSQVSWSVGWLVRSYDKIQRVANQASPFSYK